MLLREIKTSKLKINSTGVVCLFKNALHVSEYAFRIQSINLIVNISF